MGTIVRRDALKALGAAAVAASGAIPFGQRTAAAELRYPPERGAQLRVLRWKRFVQGDEDVWLSNSRKFAQQTGVPVQVESVNIEDLRPKGAMAASVGTGPDIVVGAPDMPQVYPDKCVELTELASYLSQKYGGWYDVGQRYCTVEGRWIALALAVIPFCVVYRQSMINAAGFKDIPRDLAGFLSLCQALKARGTPPGMCLGNTSGDTSWCCWLLWTHGASLVDEDNRVAINSKQTIAALSYARALYPTFVPGTLAWLDPSNNKAFLSGEISLTWNPISIYYVARNSTDPALNAIAADIQHARLPIGPVGRPTELHGCLAIWIFKYTKYPNAAREYVRFMLERDQFDPWEQASLGFMAGPLQAYESHPIWTSDPKITPFRGGPRTSLYRGYPGKVGPASAASTADFVVENMVAEAASGELTPQEAIAKAERRARRYYKA
ncbi:MAG TPA: extracellular solute-binding protein [Burkholderiales bacterium]|nr:extracellular solute-binding protein [Burkholderiales bacterium]